MGRSAAAANTYGVSMDELLGYITAIQEVTRDSGANVGNSLKTIFSRITMSGSVNALKDVGIGVFNDDGTTRDFSRIVEDLAGKWDTLTNAQQQNLAVQLAGRYQLVRFLGLMQNYDVAVKATNTSINSQGSALQENARYLESANAKVNKLKVAWEELALSAGNTVFIDMITTITNDLRYLVNAINALVSLDPSKGNLVAGFTMLAGLTGGLTTLMNGGIRNAVFDGSMGDTIKEKLGGVSLAYEEATKKVNENRLATQNAVPIGGQAITTMDKLKGAAVATGGGFKVAGAAVAGFAKTVGVAIATSLGIGLAIAGVTMAVGFLFKKFNEYRARAAEEKQKQKEELKLYTDNAVAVDELSERYETLKNKTNKSVEETQLMYDTAKQLGSYIPNLVSHVDELGRTHLVNAVSTKEYVDTLKEAAQVKAYESYEKTTKKVKENTEALKKLKEEEEQLAKQKENARKQTEKPFVQPTTPGYGATQPSSSSTTNSYAPAAEAITEEQVQRNREKYTRQQIKNEQKSNALMLERNQLLRKSGAYYAQMSDEYANMSAKEQELFNATYEQSVSALLQQINGDAKKNGVEVDTEKAQEQVEELTDRIMKMSEVVSNLPSFDKTLFEGMSGNNQGTAYRQILDDYLIALKDVEAQQKKLLVMNNADTSAGLSGQALIDYQMLASVKSQVASAGQEIIDSANSEGIALSNTTVEVFEQNKSLDENRKSAIDAVASMSDLEEVNSDVAGAVSSATNAIDELGSALGYADGAFRSAMDAVDTYNDILAKNAEGYTYTVDEMVNLIDKNPDLVRAFEVQNGVVSLNTGVVEELREVQRLQFLEKLKQTQEQMLADALGAQMFAKYSGDKIKSIKTVADAEKELVRVKKEAALEVARIEGAMASIDKDDPNYGRQMYAGDLAARMTAQIESDTKAIQDSLDNIEQFGKNAEKIGAAIVTPSRDLYNANKAAAESNKKMTDSEKNKQDTLSNSIYITNKYTEAIDKATAAVERQNKIKNAQVRGSKAYVTQALGEIKMLEKQRKAMYDYVQVLRKANDAKKIIAGTGVHTSTTDVVTDGNGNVISTGGTYKDYDMVAGTTTGSGGFQKTGTKKLSGWNGINSGYGGVRTINGMTWKHEGIDVKGSNGERLDSNVNGTVVWAGGANASMGIPSAYGNNVVIQSTDGNYHIYAHLNKITAKKGSKIGAGQQIGTVGSTGNSTGAHLHYEVRSKMGKWGQNLINPTAYAKQAVSSKRNTYTYSTSGIGAPVAKASAGYSSSTRLKNNQGSGVFKGKEYLFNKYAEQYGVDPALALAIAHWETGNGTSKGAKVYNNPGGLMSPSSNWSKQTVFKSLDEGIEAMISNLSRNYIQKGLTSISEIQKKYAPNGVANDPNGLNAYWTNGVSSMYKKIAGGAQKATSSSSSGGSAAKTKSEQSQRDAERQAALVAQEQEEAKQRQAYQDLLDQISEVTFDYLAARADIFKRMYDSYNADEEMMRQRLEMTSSATRDSLAVIEELHHNAKLQSRSVKLELEQMQRDRKSHRYKDMSAARKAEFDDRMKQLERQLKLEKYEELKVVKEIADERRAIREKLYEEQMRRDRQASSFYERQLAVMDGESNADLVEKYALTVKQEEAERRNYDLKKRQLFAEKSYLAKVREQYGVNSEMYKSQLEAVERYSDELLQLESTINGINSSQKDMLQSMTGDMIETIRDAIDKQREAELKSIDKVQESRMKAIQNERNARQKAHEKTLKEMDDERDRINKYFDERMKQLDDADDSRSHQKQMDEYAKREKEIRSALNRISMDDSFEAKAKRKELNAELTSLNEERDEYLYGRNLEKQKEALEEERDNYLENIDKKQEAEEDSYEQFEEMLDKREEAEEALFEKLKEQLNQYYDDVLNDERKWNAIREQAMKGNFDAVQSMAQDMLKSTSNGLKEVVGNLGTTFSDILTDLEYVYADSEFKTISLTDSITSSLQDLVATNGNSFASLGNIIQQNYIDKLKEALELMKLMEGQNYDTKPLLPKEQDGIADPNGSGALFMYAKQKGSANAISVRESAGAGAKTIGTLVDGQKYQVIEQTALNSKVKLGNGQIGWVSNDELATSDPKSPWAGLFSNTQSKEVKAYKDPIDNLLWSYNSNGAAHKGRLENIAYKSGKELYNQMVKDSTGRISSKYDSAMKKYYADFESAKNTAERNKAIDTLTATLKNMQDEIDRAKREFDALYKDLQGTTGINKKSTTTMDSALYSEPYGTSSNIVATIKKGTQVQVLSDRGLYYEVMYGNKKGYVNKDRIASFRTGGMYTGDFEGDMPAFLHKKELVLNQEQTQNMLKTVEFTDRMITPLRALIGKLQSVKGGNSTPSIHIESINNDFSNNEIKDGKDASKTFMEETMNMINNKFGKR